MINKKKELSESTIGIWYGIAAYILWGFLPIYWKLIKEVPAGEILAHRIVWSFVFVSIILFINKRWGRLKEVLANRKSRIGIIISGLIISGNWFTYIYAVNSSHIVEASLGYYISPLFSVLLGLVILREELNFWQYISLAFATVGVVILTMKYGSVPWIALILAISFGFYGLAKKMTNVDSIIGLALETFLVTPIAIAYILFKEINGTGSFGLQSLLTTLLLIGAGVATATPLLWFANAAKRIPLATVGFLQYLAPSISLLIGVFMYKESFTKIHLLSFGFIWTALTIYSFSRNRLMLYLQPKIFKKNKISANVKA